MIRHPHDDALVLFDPVDLEQDPAPHPLVGEHRADLLAVVAWARAYLCRPHPDLGRVGPVCPYAQTSLDRSAFRLAVRPGGGHSVASLSGLLAPYRDWFLDLAPRGRPGSHSATILVLLPGMRDAQEVIDAAQRELKDAYVAHGLMIGEFHDGPPDKAGLWNPDFRPLRSPVPMLVIRHMVPTDLPFLIFEEAHLAAYRDLFGEQVPGHLRNLVAKP
ncbi:hypothetical protein OUY22_13460 [Nonomuraea sp. MCN248]|uniref:DUF6875 domain-containing protein n=1 Tax=Nonomuraea corallina TaxID=2989783 RepID=A0ABT4SB44_9ACTN|nr:hypothetical protein [Nonomuraea corallina]MDA0634426.1 hypothetical protein [Nonomuraea corallina]